MQEGRSDLGPTEPTEPSTVRPLPAEPERSSSPSRARIGWTCLALAFVSLVLVRDFMATVVLASWFAVVLWSWRDKLVKRWGRPAATASFLTVALLVAFLVPLGVLGVSIGIAIAGWAQAGIEAARSGNFNAIIDFLLGREKGGAAAGGGRLTDLVREAARTLPSVLAGVGAVLGGLADFIVKTFLFIVGVYSFLVYGRQIRRFTEQVSPFSAAQTRRFMDIYGQTGRGMLVGVFLVMLMHGVIAGIGYLVIGIPRALELGGLTAIASLVPAIGTGIVWLPITVVMAITGQVGRAIATFVLGLAIGTIDNVMRPWLSRLGEVPLPTFALFVAMFGGVAALGPSGLLLGPLLLAFAKTAAELYMEQKASETKRHGA